MQFSCETIAFLATVQYYLPSRRQRGPRKTRVGGGYSTTTAKDDPNNGDTFINSGDGDVAPGAEDQGDDDDEARAAAALLVGAAAAAGSDILSLFPSLSPCSQLVMTDQLSKSASSAVSTSHLSWRSPPLQQPDERKSLSRVSLFENVPVSAPPRSSFLLLTSLKLANQRRTRTSSTSRCRSSRCSSSPPPPPPPPSPSFCVHCRNEMLLLLLLPGRRGLNTISIRDLLQQQQLVSGQLERPGGKKSR